MTEGEWKREIMESLNSMSWFFFIIMICVIIITVRGCDCDLDLITSQSK